MLYGPETPQNRFTVPHYHPMIKSKSDKKNLFFKTSNYLLNIFISEGNKDQYLCQKLYIHYFIPSLVKSCLILVYKRETKVY